MPKGVPFKTEEERLEAARARARNYARLNKEKRKAYQQRPEVIERRRERDRNRLRELRKDPEYRKKKVAIQQAYRNRNREEIREKNRKKYNTNEEFKKKTREDHKRWYEKNKEGLQKTRRLKYQNDPEYRARRIKEMHTWRDKNPDHLKNYRQKNKLKINAYERLKTKNDQVYRIGKNLRARMRDLIKRNLKKKIIIEKKNGTQNLLGCKFNELKEYIESKWLEGMSWENYGPKGWHIDHIIPAGILDLTLTDNQKFVCNFKNLQPLWAKDNLEKSAIIKKIFKKDVSERTIKNWLSNLRSRLRKNLDVKTKILEKDNKKILIIEPKIR